MKSEEELHKLVEKVIDDFAAWDEDERYKEPEKELVSCWKIVRSWAL